MSLPWLAGIIVITGISVWTAGVLLQSRTAYRSYVQVAMILAALVVIVVGFMHGLHFRLR